MSYQVSGWWSNEYPGASFMVYISFFGQGVGKQMGRWRGPVAPIVTSLSLLTTSTDSWRVLPSRSDEPWKILFFMFNLERNKQNLVIGRFRKNVSKLVRSTVLFISHLQGNYFYFQLISLKTGGKCWLSLFEINCGKFSLKKNKRTVNVGLFSQEFAEIF